GPPDPMAPALHGQRHRRAAQAVARTKRKKSGMTNTFPDDLPPDLKVLIDDPAGADTKQNTKRKPRARTKDSGPAWLDGCLHGETGKPLPTVANILIGLRADYPDTFAYDEMRCATVFKRSRIPIVDTDIIKFQETFQLAGLKRIGGETVLDGIKLHSR